jgi:hypothetical protein
VFTDQPSEGSQPFTNNRLAPFATLARIGDYSSKCPGMNKWRRLFIRKKGRLEKKTLVNGEPTAGADFSAKFAFVQFRPGQGR